MTDAETIKAVKAQHHKHRQPTCVFCALFRELSAIKAREGKLVGIIRAINHTPGHQLSCDCIYECPLKAKIDKALQPNEGKASGELNE